MHLLVLDTGEGKPDSTHQPTFGWGWTSPASDASRAAWIAAANAAGVDLVIAGHNHRFSLTPAGAQGNRYPVLVVGQDQVANISATETTLQVQVVGKDGAEVRAFTVARRGVLPRRRQRTTIH